jgi:methionyl-tRNA formyltransferase
VRAVAPPYPGATTQLIGKPMRILQTLVAKGDSRKSGKPAFYVSEGKAYAICGSGELQVVRFELDGAAMSAADFSARHGAEKFEFNR